MSFVSFLHSIVKFASLIKASCNHLLNETDVSKNAARIFLLDFSKAFDHNILLSKLSDMEVPSIITNWIKLDEANGSECSIVCQNGKSSTAGSPRGTVLGPILFLVKINGLLPDWKDRWKYVDDTTTTETISPYCNSNLQDLVN